MWQPFPILTFDYFSLVGSALFCSGSGFAVSDGSGSVGFADFDSVCSGSDTVGSAGFDFADFGSADYCFSRLFHPFQTNCSVWNYYYRFKNEKYAS